MSTLLSLVLYLFASSAGPAFGENVVMVTTGSLTDVPIVGGHATPARLVCPAGVLGYAASRLSDGDTVQLMAGPVPLAGPFVVRCTLRSADGFDGLWVVYAGP